MPQNPLLLRLHEMFATARFTQPYGCTGYEREPAYGNCLHFHKGVDMVLEGGTGASVFSPASGVVTRTNLGGLGYSIEIKAPNGFTYILGHMNHPLTLQPGQTVLAGQFVGEQGSSGNSSATHLHFEIHDPNGNPVDPQGGGTWDDWRRTWYTVFHSLGAGAGYSPGQGITSPPDPRTPGWGGTVPTIPFFNGHLPTWEDANGTPDPTLPNQDGYPNYSNAGSNNSGVDLSAALGIVGLLFGSADDEQTAQSREKLGLTLQQWGRGCILLVAGAVLLVLGLWRLTKEGPAQAVIQPVTSTVKAGAKIATAVA